MRNYSKIISGCLSQDHQSQMAFYDLFHMAAYNSSYRIVGDTGEAEEVMQEIILRIFERKLFQDTSCGMEKYIRRAAVNMSIDIIRKRKNTFIMLDDNSFARQHSEERQQEEDARLPDPATLAKALMQLPEGYRAVLSMKLFEGMDNPQIAEKLQITTEGVRSQYSRGKEKLRKILHQYEKR